MPETPPPTPQPPPAPVRRRGYLLPLTLLVLFVSLLVNFGTLLVYSGAVDNPLEADPSGVNERFFLGDPNAKDKIAVVRVTGVLTDGGIAFAVQQLEAAARDKRVRAVVLRINSPGGTVTSSEELYQNIVNVRDDNGRRFKGTGPKPVSVSMGGVAASGGYYIAVAGKPISAEPTTITGSIGVFVAIPNLAKLAQDHGVKLELIKAGGIKAAGSFLHDLSPQERQTWQDTVDTAYDQFLSVITANRPALTTAELRDKIIIDRPVPVRDEKGNPKKDAAGNDVMVKYTRVRADGGTYTPKDALAFGLIDKIEDLPATIRASASANGLGTFKAVVYERPQGLVERLTGLNVKNRQALPDIGDVSAALAPRLWYLSPAADVGLASFER